MHARCVVLLAIAVPCMAFSEPALPPPPSVPLLSAAPTAQVDISVANEARAAVDRGLQWLASVQKSDGSWSNPDFPAMTALPLWAFSLAANSRPEWGPVTSNALQYLLSCVQTNGGIYRNIPGKGGGLSNYNTAIAMVALHASGEPTVMPVVQRARAFVAAGQHFGGDIYEGGMGYDRDTGRPYTDLSDSVIAYEAMRLTQGVEDARPSGEKHVDLDWEAARRFLDRVQNKASAGPDNAGGFIYRPDESKAGATTNADGTVVFRSFGSMTYAGLLSLIYADVDRDDPRVRSAFEWASKHWTLDENPGMGQQGLFYFYNILSKSLSTYGQELIPLDEGTRPLAWRTAFIERLLKLQKVDPKTGYGYWVNDSGRFMESDPVLVTAYALIAMEVALGR